MTDLSRFAVELRAEVSGNRIRGHASVFGQVADLGPLGLEAVDRRAFDRVLADPATDVRALVNHHPTMVLGRQRAGTLELRADDVGLAFDVELPDTTYANDLRESVRRGDVTGASFGFVPGQVRTGRHGRRTLRTHVDVRRLVDVSVVTFPAYEGAGVALRAFDTLADPAAANRSKLIRARARRRGVQRWT